MACGAASASSIFSVSALVTFSTDGTYTLTLNKFNNTGGLVLTGATMYFYGSENISNLELASTANGVQTFNALDESNLNSGSSNTANNSDRYTGEVLDIFDTGIGPGQANFPTVPGAITLGGGSTVVPCPLETPGPTCNDVKYTPPERHRQ